MKPITINELADALESLKKAGYGEYAVQVSDDEEMNGTHCLWDTKPYLGEDVEYLNQHTKKMEKSKSLIFG